MTDQNPGNPEPDRSDEPIANLIRLAGSRVLVPDERATRVRNEVHARWRDGVARERRRFMARLWACAAALLALALGAGLWLRDGGRPAGPPVAALVRVQGRVLVQGGGMARTGGSLAPGAVLTTDPEGRAALRLGDGGPSIRLDGGSELRLVTARRLELQHGAVYVDTGTSSTGGAATSSGDEAGAADAGASRNYGSIEINTRLGRVRDIGTQFEVRLGQEGLNVSVREGIAVLERADHVYSASAGTRLTVDPQGAIETREVAAGGTGWSWVLEAAPPFDLEGRTLREYLVWLSRETGRRIEYADPDIEAGSGSIVLHGSTGDLRPDETPAAVLPTCGLRHRTAGESIIIERAGGPRGRG